MENARKDRTLERTNQAIFLRLSMFAAKLGALGRLGGLKVAHAKSDRATRKNHVRKIAGPGCV